MKYEAIDSMPRADVDATVARDHPEELLRAVLSVALHSDDEVWASSSCLRLAAHPHFNVRGNAILGLGHRARRHRRLDSAVRSSRLAFETPMRTCAVKQTVPPTTPISSWAGRSSEELIGNCPTRRCRRMAASPAALPLASAAERQYR